uniref:Nudix hydrolase domain-containing protein n=1 Tax=Calcidiscus leptoporus TaxID=127549 RepID=A0A7S0IYY5_9EUKA|mmetsp:Transcript_3056/g.6912  ORF Transcript_3056/g.6912 Transcript_3056/m.6912 type:complete len:231 (+) Transcript_3056:122-814(+)
MFRRAARLAATLGTAGATVAHVTACQRAEQLPRVRAVDDVASTRWLKLQTITYEDSCGKMRKWDMAVRTTKKKGAGADAVAIMALLRSASAPGELHTILVRQFRPPVEKTTLELPAGLIDPGESAEEAALRELREETGFVGSARSCTGPLALSPGLTNESVQIVVVDVDLDAPENQQPEQRLEETESIQVQLVSLSKLHETLQAAEAEGLMVFMALYALADGIKMGYAMK